MIKLTSHTSRPQNRDLQLHYLVWIRKKYWRCIFVCQTFSKGFPLRYFTALFSAWLTLWRQFFREGGFQTFQKGLVSQKSPAATNSQKWQIKVLLGLRGNNFQKITPSDPPPPTNSCARHCIRLASRTFSNTV